MKKIFNLSSGFSRYFDHFQVFRNLTLLKLVHLWNTVNVAVRGHPQRVVDFSGLTGSFVLLAGFIKLPSIVISLLLRLKSDKRARRLKKRWKCYQTLKDIGLRQYESDESARESVDSVASITWLTAGHKKIGSWNTIENVAWNSLIGFLGGVLLTYTFFMFFHLGVNISIRSSTCISALAGIMLSLGLAFSTKIRCFVLLLLPVFFSKQGRQALLAYALFLAFTGPARNTMHNMGILSDSMNCGQQIVKKTFKQIVEMRKMPSKSIKDTLQKIKNSAEKAAAGIKLSVIKLKKAIIAVLEVVRIGNAWLRSIVNLCNVRVGSPFQRCMKSFEASITECKARVGVLDFLCHVVHIKKGLCYTFKFHDFICLFTEFVSDKAIEVVRKKLRKFHFHMKELFYVSIELRHSCKNKTKASYSTKQLAKTILQRFSEKVEQLQSIFSVFGFMYSLLFVFLFAKVYYYKYKYLSSDRYDNVYINKYIIDLDIKRAQLGKETVLPLEPRERRKYGKPTALRLLECERSRIAQSMFLLSLTSFKVVTFVAVDYCLFWILLTICKAGYNSVKEVEDSKFGIRVHGEGVLADFYRGLGKAFQVPKNPYMHLTPLHCLPDPLQPDTRRYVQIGFLVLLCWILTFTEAYGLRLRGVVMSYYYPERARERAVWLYNDILRSRGSFIRFARRQLRKKFGTIGVMPVEKMTCTQQFLASFPLLGHTLRGRRKMKCLICGIATAKGKPEHLRRCQTPDCPGRYCKMCYQTLENVCTICQHPIEYEDMSDISEEVDSSEEDLYVRKRNKNFKYDSDSSEDVKNFKALQEVDTHEKFQDAEACKALDLVSLDDFNTEKAQMQQRLSDLLLQFTSKTKLSVYRQIKLKLTEKINTLKRLKREKLSQTEIYVSDDNSIGSGKSENKKKLSEYMVEPQSLQEKLSKSRTEHMSEDTDDSNIKPRFMSYYFVEREKESAFRTRGTGSRVRSSEEISEDKNYTL